MTDNIAVITMNDTGEHKIRMSIIQQKHELSPELFSKLQECVRIFGSTLSELANIFGSSNTNYKNIIININENENCLSKMQNTMHSLIINKLFHWFQYANTQSSDLNINAKSYCAGENLTNRVDILDRIPKQIICDAYSRTPFREKMIVIDTHYGLGIENLFYEYIKNNFKLMSSLKLHNVLIEAIYVSYYYPIVDGVTEKEFTVYQFFFYNKTTYYVLTHNNKIVCDYVLTSKKGELNIHY